MIFSDYIRNLLYICTKKLVNRELQSIISQRLFKGKAIVIVGPRQVGKTTLLKALIQETGKKTLFFNCDEPDVRKQLDSPTSTQWKNLIGDATIVLIDEAQRIKDIGITLKLLVDNFPEKQVIVTGSSALELSNIINEPLTGRKFEYQMLPFSTRELIQHTDFTEEKRLLNNRLIFGLYPDVVNNPGNETEILLSLATSYLYKDIFTFQDVRKPEIIEKLLQALALQIGSEVSIHELAQLLGIDSGTVLRYIDLLEKAYLIFHLRSYSKNVRNELKKSRKIYFYDNGIRNALIANFSPATLRNDVGALWENFLISERIKRNNYDLNYAKSWFWRTTQQQEIDYIEEKDGLLTTYEFKWNTTKKPRLPLTFSQNYPGSDFRIISPENYLEVVG